MLAGEGQPAGSQMMEKALSMRGHKKPDEQWAQPSTWMLIVWGRERGRKEKIAVYFTESLIHLENIK